MARPGYHVRMSHSDSSRLGFVYILSCPSVHSYLKIGATRNHPLRRAREVSAGTGVPIPYTLAYFRDFVDAFTAERLTHEWFAEQRVNDSREFFDVSLGDVVAFVDGLANSDDYQGGLVSMGEVGGAWTTEPRRTVATPFADLFASFPDDGSPRELTPEEQAKCRALEAQHG